MALTEETYADKIEVINPAGFVHVRMATIIKRDEEEISRNFHRYVLEPGADLTGQPSQVVAICTAAWT